MLPRECVRAASVRQLATQSVVLDRRLSLPPQEGLDLYHELLGRHWFRQNFIESDAPEPIYLTLADQTTEGDQYRVPRTCFLLEDFHRLEAADRRHHEIEEDDVGAPITRHIQAFVRRWQSPHVEPRALEEALMRGANGRIIIDDENARDH